MALSADVQRILDGDPNLRVVVEELIRQNSVGSLSLAQLSAVTFHRNPFKDRRLSICQILAFSECRPVNDQLCDQNMPIYTQPILDDTVVHYLSLGDKRTCEALALMGVMGFRPAEDPEVFNYNNLCPLAPEEQRPVVILGSNWQIQGGCKAAMVLTKVDGIQQADLKWVGGRWSVDTLFAAVKLKGQ